jgi:hypothetical protein
MTPSTTHHLALMEGGDYYQGDDEMKPYRCPKCNTSGGNLGLILTPGGPHYGMVVCLDSSCRRTHLDPVEYGFVAWYPKPRNDDDREFAESLAVLTPPCPQLQHYLKTLFD